MTVHNFDASLRMSHAYADAPWWNEVYQNFFPGCMVQDMRQDGWWQRAGIDRRLHLLNGTSVSVDEKVREKDWPDFALEAFWDWKGTPAKSAAGWMELAAANQLACDYLAYAFVPSQTCYLLPMRELARAWVIHRREWWANAKENRRGFRFAEAPNRGRGGRSYVTLSVCVPHDVVLGAIADAMRTTWTTQAKPVDDQSERYAAEAQLEAELYAASHSDDYDPWGDVEIARPADYKEAG